MKLHKLGLALRLFPGALVLAVTAIGCKDDDPCDPGQIFQNTQCYPASANGGAAGSAGAMPGEMPDAAAGTTSEGRETAFGTACQDTAGSSDCAGIAPICADLTKLGQSVMCTQINCAAGEANAGVCPEWFSCFAFPGYPSVCTKE